MRKIILLIVVILSVGWMKLSGQELHLFVSETRAKQLGVKTAVMKSYWGDNEEPSMSYTQHYDTNGRVTTKISFNHHFNSITNKTFLFYNNKGQLISEHEINYNGKDSTVYDQTFSYNSKGQADEKFGRKIEYKYDNEGRVIQSAVNTLEGCMQKNVYLYDSLGNLEYEEEYLCTTLVRKRIFIYNREGQITKEIDSYFSSQKGPPESAYENTFLYNENGLVITKHQKQTIVPRFDKVANRLYTYEYTFY